MMAVIAGLILSAIVMAVSIISTNAVFTPAQTWSMAPMEAINHLSPHIDVHITDLRSQLDLPIWIASALAGALLAVPCLLTFCIVTFLLRTRRT